MSANMAVTFVQHCRLVNRLSFGKIMGDIIRPECDLARTQREFSALPKE